MYTITMKSGKTFDSDYAVEGENPDRLHINIINSDAHEVAAIFTDPNELPIEGYPSYTRLDMLIFKQEGVQLCLRKEN